MNLRQVAATVTGKAIIGFATLLTGVQVRWAAGHAPQALQTVYFTNHTSHGDFVLVWAALPSDLRALTRPVAGADYWNTSALRRFVGHDVFRALMIRRDGAAAQRNAGHHAEGASEQPSGSGVGHETVGTPHVRVDGTLDRADNSTVDRTSNITAQRRVADPIEQMADTLEAGDSLIMFPEGTRNIGDDVLLPLKSGLFHLATRRPEARLVPVWIENLRRVLPKGVLLPVPLACSVHFGAPLERIDGEDKAAFVARARAALLALRPDHDKENDAAADKPGNQERSA